MNSLTQEQRDRMEENRRKALEKRAAAAASAAKAKTSNAFLRLPVPVMPNSSLGTSQQQSKQQPAFQNTMQQPAFQNTLQQNKIPQGMSTSSTATATTNKGSVPYNFKQSFVKNATSQPLHPAKPMQQANVPYLGKAIAGTCVVISKERFKVDIGYHAPLIAIFKSIKGCQYDTLTKKWDFPISEHGNLITAVQPLKPAVVIGAIPLNVLKVLSKAIASSNIDIKENDLRRIDPVLKEMLMPFQKDGVNFGINRNGRVLIADDMGLGKTIQALGIAHYYYSEWPLLVVAPSSVRYAWRDAIWNWLPSVPAGSIVVIETSKDDFYSAKVIIASYDLLQKRSEDLSHIKVVIMDESHHLKNPKAARTRAAMPIIKNARRAILLSGTPALSRPVELFPQVSAVAGQMFPVNNFQDFGIRYCNGKKNAWGMDFTGSSNMLELQLILEETVMIRRLKSDVLKQLPPKLRKLVVLDPSLIKLTGSGLRTTANAFMEGKSLKPTEARGKLLEYYNETAKTKLTAVSAYIKDLVEAGKKFICFAHHRSLMDGISNTLEEIKCNYIRIDGTTSPEDRQLSVEQFQTCDNILVAVLSICAANSGITLTAAGLVVFAELYWNPGILTQAEDRAHRIGQQDSVVVEYLIAKGTSDDVMWPMVKEKLTVLNQAGLSKDNFHEADTSDFMATAHSKQKDISDFFQQLPASQTSVALKTSASTISVTDELAALEADQDLLLQLLDESFGDENYKMN